MQEKPAVATRYHFGPFTLDPSSGELHKGPTRLKVPDQSIAILTALLERSGQVVTRDELRHRLWPENHYVDFEHGLNAAVRRLRDALNDSAETPKFIETLPKRGYRFIAPLTPEAPRAPISVPDGSAARPRRVLWRFIAVVALIVLVSAAAFLRWRRQSQSGYASRVESPIVRQLTFDPGLQMNPAISPDGKFVAYASNQNGNFDIWVKPVDTSSPPIQVTTNPAHDWQPDWSPDGDQIVFRSERDGGGLYLVPAYGGVERQLVDFGYGPRWSPDGTKVLFSRLLLAGAGRGDISFIDVNDRKVQTVRLPPPLPGAGTNPEIGWDPDNKHITLFVGSGPIPAPVPHFVTVDVVTGGATYSVVDPKVLDSFGEQRVWHTPNESLVWDRARRSIYFIGYARGIHNLFAVDVDPHTLAITGGPHRLTTTVETNEGVSISQNGARVVVGAANTNPRVWIYALDSSGKRVLRGSAVSDAKVFAASPDLTTDGAKLLLFQQYRGSGTGRTELWERLLGPNLSERLLLTWQVPSEARVFPRWSPDGKAIAYRLIRNGPAGGKIVSLTLFDVTTLKERQLTTAFPADSGNEVPYGWSSDGQSVVSSSTRFTQHGTVIALLPVAAAPEAEKRARIIRVGEFNAWNTGMSPDGKWICFQAQRADVSRLAVVRADHGETTGQDFLTPEDTWIDKPRWSTDGGILYYISRRGGIFNVWGVAFDSGRGKTIGEPFQVTQFDGLGEQIPSDMQFVELGVGDHRLAFPVIQPTGGIWLLENFR